MKKMLVVCVAIILCILSGTSSYVNAQLTDESLVYQEKYLPLIQGTWYDLSGKPFFVINGDTLNGCKITKFVQAGDYGGGTAITLRVLEATGYRDIYIECTNLRGNPDSYHQYMRYSANRWSSNHYIMLRRTPKAHFYESVGGVGLGMSEQDVLQLYGEPTLKRTNDASGWPSTSWLYANPIGMELTFEEGIVCSIKIQSSGNRRFDRTAMNCNDSLDSYWITYGIKGNPTTDGCWNIGHREYLCFENYPESIELTYFYD